MEMKYDLCVFIILIEQKTVLKDYKQIDKKSLFGSCIIKPFSILKNKTIRTRNIKLTKRFNNGCRMYGECVEKVEAIWPEIRRGRGRGRGRGPALFGRVVFNNSCLPPIILRNKDHAKFWVHGRPLWCKKFLPH